MSSQSPAWGQIAILKMYLAVKNAKAERWTYTLEE